MITIIGFEIEVGLNIKDLEWLIVIDEVWFVYENGMKLFEYLFLGMFEKSFEIEVRSNFVADNWFWISPFLRQMDHSNKLCNITVMEKHINARNIL